MTVFAAKAISAASAISAAWGKVWPFIIAIFFFGLLIMVHELGHFSFAKLFRVKVHRFALGMGPRILKFGKGETEYSLRLFPIGGYVMMEGEDEESEDPRAFKQKKAWQRFCILAAGAITNLIMGFVILSIMLAQSDLIGTTKIHSFREEEKPAQSRLTGLQVGDEILKLNGKKLYADSDLTYLMMRDADGVFDILVRRDGALVELPNVEFNTRQEDGRTIIMYDFIILGEKPMVGTVLEGAWKESVSMSRLIWMSLFDIVTGQFRMSDLAGPIGAVNIVAQAAEQKDEEGNWDPTGMLIMMAMIALNVGLFNLLPLPALDGGRLFFLLIEIVFRKKVPAKYEAWVHGVGMVLLLLLMVVISFSDIVNLIRN